MVSPIARAIPSRVAAHGGSSPRCRASQARAYRQSRLSVLTDAPEHIGGFFDGEPGVIAELNHLSQLRVLCLKLLDRLIQGEQIAAGRLDPGQAPSTRSMRRAWPPCLKLALRRACSIRISRIACAAAPKKWRRPSQPGILALHQAEIRLVDEGCRLEGLARGQAGCQRRRQAAQLVVENRQ